MALPTLRRDATGDAVTALQERLAALGYDLGRTGADGTFGRHTHDAGVKFQKVSGLTADGVMGHHTWEALDLG